MAQGYESTNWFQARIRRASACWEKRSNTAQWSLRSHKQRNYILHENMKRRQFFCSRNGNFATIILFWCSMLSCDTKISGENPLCFVFRRIHHWRKEGAPMCHWHKMVYGTCNAFFMSLSRWLGYTWNGSSWCVVSTKMCQIHMNITYHTNYSSSQKNVWGHSIGLQELIKETTITEFVDWFFEGQSKKKTASSTLHSDADLIQMSQVIYAAHLNQFGESPPFRLLN